ncbi:FAD-binding oxidoreductase [Paraburkholderia sp. DGU8]|uniref:FAD-binding oxidoreductase n=1 Tax=Paraburkholderia sp. DGU8 TaxID=3161997 RepID=UPI003465E1FD
MDEFAIQGFRGRLIVPSDKDYDEARALYNGMIDKRPKVIARCTDAADVIAAVNYARDNKLLLAIRGGGHNGPGLGSCDGGLVIDLSQMRSVRVDPASRTVRVDPGCTAADLDHATYAFGLAVPLGIVGSTGVAGLTLGGGTGYLTRKHGRTVDNLLEVDVVLADGSVVTASKDKHADLFWAVRGGGGNFGVVTSFLFQAHRPKWCSPVRSSGTPRTPGKLWRRTATSSQTPPKSLASLSASKRCLQSIPSLTSTGTSAPAL